MWAALTALATALAEYLRLRQLTAAYDLQCRIESDLASAEVALVGLRDRGDDLSARAADRLRARILRAQGIARRLDLPAARTPAGGEPEYTDTGRDLHA